ncbi:MAG TPA: rhomboid family intramembrane serine protease [Flavobacterium sp.]|nr:rhomboid family intramembrane serine protease [Flavobacterium sp.]
MNIITIGIIALNVLISYKGFNNPSFFRKYEFHIGNIKAGEQIRMISSAFLHVDIAHLTFNMLTLYFFAPIIFDYFSSIIFLYIYFGSLITGNLLTYYFHNSNYSYRAVGASGAITGIVYSAIVLVPNLELQLFFAIPIPGYAFGLGYLLYSIYGMKAKNDTIGHTAHIGGAIGGYIITIAKMPNLIFENTFMVVVLAIPIVLLLFLHRTNKL